MFMLGVFFREGKETRVKTGKFGDCLVAALVGLLLSAALAAQEAEEKKPEPPQAEARQAASKPALAEATRVSTDAAVKSAAQKKAGTSAAEDAPSKSDDSAVTELHPAAQTPETSSAESPKTVKKSSSRKIHGTVYGAAGTEGGNASRSGGSVGATSKSGKTSVYVETERSRQSPTTSK